MRMIMLHRLVEYKEVSEIIYINADNINFFSACADGKGTRITMPNCFFLVEEDPGKVLYKIQRECLNHAN